MITKIDIVLRPPTGAMQFTLDWPGLFIRGDDCFTLVAACEAIEAGDYKHPGVLYLKEFLKAIDRDVIQRT